MQLVEEFIKTNIIIICVSSPKSASFCPSLGFLAEAQPRLETGEDKRHFLAEVHIHFFKRPRKLQSKIHTSSEKLQIYFVSTFFK
jgi:hypothetical protein